MPLRRLFFWLIGAWIVYCMMRHEASDNFPWYVIGKWWIAKEWVPAIVMLIWCALAWKRERPYAYLGLALSLIGFWYGFMPYLIKN